MQPRESKDLFQQVIWEVLTYVVYVGGIVLIERGPKLAGLTELPPLADFTLKGMELALLLAIVTKVAKGLDAFITALTGSVMYKAILNMKRKKSTERSSNVEKALAGGDNPAVNFSETQESLLEGDPGYDRKYTNSE